MRFPIRLAAPLLALFAAACQDQPTVSDPHPSVERSQDPERHDDERIVRFEVSLAASGSFRPGTPIRLTARVHAAIPTSQARISITLPEVRAAERTGWGPEFYLPVGERLSSLAEWTISLGAGEEVIRGATVTIPAPGVYRAVVTAVADPDPNETRTVQDVSHSEIWIVVDEQGGRAVPEWRPDLVPAGMISEAGPFRTRGRSAPASAPRRSHSGPLYHHDPQVDDPYGGVRVVYWHTISQTYATVPGAQVYLEYWDRDWDGNPVELISDLQYTDANGYFWVDCSLDNYYTNEVTFSGTVTLANNDVDLRHSPYFNGGTVYDACAYYMYSYSRTVGVASNPGHVYVNMNQVITNSKAYFGISRQQIRVTLGEYGGDISKYDRGWTLDDEEIKLDNDDVWGTGGVFTQAHEYGHAFHDKALGIATANYCGSGHSLGEAINLQCAYFEGFADYFAVATMGGATGLRASRIESNYYLGSNTDGSIVEGAVAAFLLDLSDPANESHDNAHYGGNYVARIVQTCRVRRSGWTYFAAADGVDDLAYCFEQAIDPAVANSSIYFTTRSNDAVAFTESATEPSTWSAAAVRQLWMRNLYNH